MRSLNRVEKSSTASMRRMGYSETKVARVGRLLILALVGIVDAVRVGAVLVNVSFQKLPGPLNTCVPTQGG